LGFYARGGVCLDVAKYPSCDKCLAFGDVAKVADDGDAVVGEKFAAVGHVGGEVLVEDLRRGRVAGRCLRGF